MSSKQLNSPLESPSLSVRFLVKRNMAVGETYHYLLCNPEWSVKEGQAMLSQAVQDYWLAYARQLTDSDLAKTTALACVERMEYQIAKLRRDFQLESLPAPSSPDQANLEAAILELTAEVRQIPQSLNAISIAMTKGEMLPPPAVVSNRLTESATIKPELKSPHGIEALDEFLKENGSLIRNLVEEVGSS